MTDGDPQGVGVRPSRRSVSTAAISRPSRKCHRSRCAEARSMPEGPAERGSKPLERALVRALVTRRALTAPSTAVASKR